MAAILPDEERGAKDMSVFQIANSLPQSLAPAIAPLIMAISGGGKNYAAIYVTGAIFSLLGAFAINPVRRSR